MTEPLRPPPEFAHLRWHFIAKQPDQTSPIVMRYIDDCWGLPGSMDWILAQEASKRDWRYIAPAVPLPEADDATVEAVARALWLALPPHLPWPPEYEADFLLYQRRAGAAIAAIRERMTNGRSDQGR